MEEKPARFSQADSVLDEHKQLHAVLDEIEASLASRPAAAQSAPWLRGLSGRLRDLQPQLEAHFRHEEEKGLFEEIEEAMPEAAEQCDRLRGEHEALVAKVGQIRTQLDLGAERDESGLDGLVAELRTLLRRLADHEAQEDDLLFRALEGGIAAQD